MQVQLSIAAISPDGRWAVTAASDGALHVWTIANNAFSRGPQILSAGSAKPIVSLVWHAHLSMRVAFKIQTFIMKLPTRDILPARGGVNFPLSKEEMRWHLGFFDISA